MLSPVPCWVKCIINRRCITSSSLTTLLSSLLFQQLCCSTAIHQTHSENRVHTFLQHSDNQTGVGVQHMLAVHCLWFTSLLSRLIRAAERLRWQMWVATVQPRRGEKSSFSRRVDVRLVPRHDMSWQPVCLSVRWCQPHPRATWHAWGRCSSSSVLLLLLQPGKGRMSLH